MLGELGAVTREQGPCPRNEVCDTLAIGMLCCPQLQILRPIVSTVSVAMMDCLTLGKVSTEHARHDDPVFQQILATGPHFEIARGSVHRFAGFLSVPLNEPDIVASVLMPAATRGNSHGSSGTAPALAESGWWNPRDGGLDSVRNASHLVVMNESRRMIFREFPPRDFPSASAGAEDDGKTVAWGESLVLLDKGPAPAVTEMLRETAGICPSHTRGV